MTKPETDQRQRKRWTERLALAGAAATVLVLALVIWHPGDERPVIPPMRIRTIVPITIMPSEPPPQKRFQEIKKEDLTPPTTQTVPSPTIAPRESIAPLSAPPSAPPTIAAPIGSDAFGLTRGDGSGFGEGGSGGSGGRSYGAFVSAIKEKLQRGLSRDETTRYGNYQIRISLWLSDDGRLQRCHLIDSTGDTSVDQSLCRVAEDIAIFAPPPPDHRGEAVTVRVASSHTAS